MIVKRALSIGRNFESEVQELLAALVGLRAQYERLHRPDVVIPQYYRRSFHAYPEGNLCWDAALEVRPR
jgi:hypothetical protein